MFLNRTPIRLLLVMGLLLELAARAPGQGGAAESMSVVTADGVQLRGTYFAGAARKGSKQGKQTTPVILLHDYKSSRAIFAPLAQQLVAAGDPNAEHPFFAALIVDLRAHGESTKQLSPEGGIVELDPAKLSKEGLVAMSTLDMEAIRSFLVDKNDDGELNLNKLCIVGSGMGASVAVNWAAKDWAAPPLAVGKQGQDVKGLVLISPRWSFNGLSMQDALKFGPFKQNVAWLLIGGAQDQKAKTDLSRVESQIEKLHPLIEKTGGKQRSGFEVELMQSSLQGDVLLSKSADVLDAEIIKFLTANVAAIDQTWTSRRNKIP
jgi:pimeloyl-ACP methyl ester carboxylesterase